MNAVLFIYVSAPIRGILRLPHLLPVQTSLANGGPDRWQTVHNMFSKRLERVRKGKIRPGRGYPISDLLSGIEDVPTDPIRCNIPG